MSPRIDAIRPRKGPPTLYGGGSGTDAARLRTDGGIDRARPDDLLELAVDRGRVPWQVGALLVLDRAPDPAAVRQALADRVRSIPRLRRKLVRTPPLCGRPVWIDDPDFAIERHVREVTCPDPADDAALHEVAMQAVGTPLSLRHSPWAAVVVTGLHGRGALVVVFHHVLADGVGGLAVLTRLADGAPPVENGGFPRRPPGVRRLLGDAMAARTRAVAHLPRGLRQVRDAVRELRATRAPRAPRSSLTRPTGTRRALRVVRADLAAVRSVAHAHGGTINDVLLTAVGGALGTLLSRRGESTPQVVVSVPISSRIDTDAARLGNAVGVLPVAVPTTGPPIARLAAVARTTADGRAAPRAASAVLLDAAFRLVALTGALPWILDHQDLVTTFVTNLRGPTRPIAFLGARIDAVVPLTTTTGNVPVVFGALSYAGALTLTVVADPDACAELDALVADLRTEIDELCAATNPSPRPRAAHRSG
jgi:WS/DGAT/MGAT family acyltransferase